MPVAIKIPCDLKELEHSPELPPSIYDPGDELFGAKERDALIASEPEKFMMPRESDLRYNWVVVRLAAIDQVEMRELVIDAWSMVVPKHLSASYRE